MNLNILIAQRIGKKTAAKGKLSRISNIIASISVALSIAIIIIALAVAGGFRNEIWKKASGFSGEITLQAPGVEITNHLYPIAPLSCIDKIETLEGVASVEPVGTVQDCLNHKTRFREFSSRELKGTINSISSRSA